MSLADHDPLARFTHGDPGSAVRRAPWATLLGAWDVAAAELAGRALEVPDPPWVWAFWPDGVRVELPHVRGVFRWEVDRVADPPALRLLHFADRREVGGGIAALTGGELTVCLNFGVGPRPRALATSREDWCTLVRLRPRAVGPAGGRVPG